MFCTRVLPYLNITRLECKESLQSVAKTACDHLNITRLECKANYFVWQVSGRNDLNRTRLECKVAKMNKYAPWRYI